MKVSDPDPVEAAGASPKPQIGPTKLILPSTKLIKCHIEVSPLQQKRVQTKEKTTVSTIQFHQSALVEMEKRCVRMSH